MVEMVLGLGITLIVILLVIAVITIRFEKKCDKKHHEIDEHTHKEC